MKEKKMTSNKKDCSSNWRQSENTLCQTVLLLWHCWQAQNQGDQKIGKKVQHFFQK